MAREHHHFSVFRRLQVGHQAGALAIGQLQVREKYIGRLPHEVTARAAQTLGFGNGEAFGFGQFGQRLHGLPIVVDDQNVGHGKPPFSGMLALSTATKVEWSWCWDSTQRTTRQSRLTACIFYSILLARV